MEIRQLETFRVAAEVGSFTRAAVALGYVQSTVTAHIQLLETELGVTLFDRLGKGIRLTDAGKQVLQYATQILQLTQEMRGAIHHPEAIAGTLTISAPETLCIYRLPSLLRLFREQYPAVKVIFRPCRVAELRREVSEGLLDAAFILEEPVQNSGLATESLLPEPLCIIAPADHPLASASVVYPSDLTNEPILLTELGCNYRNMFEHTLIRHGVYPTQNMEFNSIEAIKQCVIAGMGISILPRIAVQGEVQQGRLSILRWFEPDLSVQSQLVFRANRLQSPLFQAFLGATRAVFSAEGELTSQSG